MRPDRLTLQAILFVVALASNQKITNKAVLQSEFYGPLEAF